jgi:hypothetical protein
MTQTWRDDGDTNRLFDRLAGTGGLCLLVAVAAVLAAVPAPAVAADQVVTGRPDLELNTQDNRLEPSADRTLTVGITNDGEVHETGPIPFEREVQTARNVRLEVLDGRIDAPIEVTSGPALLGTVTETAPRTVSFQIETGADLEPGKYRIPIRLSYDYRHAVSYRPIDRPPGYTDADYKDAGREQTRYVSVVVDEQAHFNVTAATTSGLFAGDTGTFEFTVENTGTSTAGDVRTTLVSSNKQLYFGAPGAPQQRTSVYVPSLAPGERHNASVQVGATGDLSPGTYPVEATVAYQDRNDISRQSDPLATGVTVGGERQFAIRDLETETLRVGEDDAVVRGEVVNLGPSTANGAVVRLSTGGSARVTGPESGVGDLAPGESQPVSFRLGIPEDAEPGTQSLSFAVEYENGDGDVRTTDTPIREQVEVGPERDAFRIVDVETDLRAGGSAQVDVTLRYTGSRPASNADARLFLTDPLSSSDNTAFLGDLEPGETATATFVTSASGDAVAKRYGGAVEVRYDDAGGESNLADGLRAGIPVGDSGGGLPLPYLGLGLGVVVLGGTVALYSRR